MNVNKTFFLVAATGLLAALSCVGRADDKPTLTLQEVLARHLQALGGPQAVAVPKAQRTTQTEETHGLHGSVITISRGSDRVYTEETLGVNHTYSGYDGKVAWRRDGNGSVRLLSSAEVESLHNDQYLGTFSYLFPDRLPGKVTLRPQTERKTGDYVLDVLPAGGKPCSLFLDPKTFLVVKEQHSADDLTLTTTYSDFKVFDGLLQPTTERSGDGNRDYDVVTHLTGVEDDVDAPDTLFGQPPVVKNYQWIDPKATSATIPFDASDHSINLFVGINGEPANVILDSGDSDMSISRRAADYLKLKREGALEGRGYGGSTNVYPVKLDTFEIADGVVFHDMTATAIDLPEYFGFGDATPTVGFSGYNILSQFVVRVDYAAEHIVLYDPDTWKPTAEDGQALPMELDDNVPNITAQFDDLPAAKFLIDTGDSGSAVRLYRPFVLRQGLAAKYPKGMDVGGYGVGGQTKDRRVRAKSFTIAGVTLKNVPTDLALDDKAGSSRILAGALGHDFLSHFVVTFDYPHGRVFFAANRSTQQPFDTRTFGIYTLSLPDESIKDKRRIVVVYVDHQSPAYKESIAGDTITQVDGQSADALGLGGVRRLLSADGGKDTHELSVIGPEGGTGKVKVSLYDPMPDTASR